MSEEHRKFVEFFSFKRILIPVLLGIGVALYLVFRNFDPEPFLEVRWGAGSLFWFSLAILMIIIRQLAYMYRIWLLTDHKISWKQAFDIIILWEFSSAITPSVVGGSAIALYILSKEGISPGRSTALVLVTAFLDELFYILIVPAALILAGAGVLFEFSGKGSSLGLDYGIDFIFVIGYLFILVLILIITYGLFIRPRAVKWLLLRVFSTKFLKKWKRQAAAAGDDIIISSGELRGKHSNFWVKAFGSTFISWTSRFLTVNFLILAIGGTGEQLVIFAKQLVMWVILLISPTPGSSGIAEIIFSDFLVDYIPAGLNHAVALIWRLLTFYPYIIFGAIILPIWITRIMAHKHHTEKHEIQ